MSEYHRSGGRVTTSRLRIGQGMDIHPFDATRTLYLGGIEIPGGPGLAGHSDGDALLHAVMDALLGATGREDIGTYFPPSDERWRGIRSTELLHSIMQEIRADGWRVINCDCTILAEVPKLSPHYANIRRSLAEMLHLEIGACGVKATTTEQLGAVGRREGLFASAVVLMERDEMSGDVGERGVV